MNIIIMIFLLYLAAGLIENRVHARSLRRVPLRILVNGTRGKTSVTRLITAALNEAGIRAYGKTTGSESRYILPDGSELEYRKKRPVNIIEQVRFIRLAKKGGAKAAVVECMALKPENQLVTAEKLIRPQYTVITNAFVDHVDEIGETEEETVRTLALSIPKGGVAVTADARFAPFSSRCISPADVALDDVSQDFSFPVHADNLRLALALTDELNIPRETALRGMLAAKPDLGMSGPFHIGECTVHNAFAANDPASFRAALEQCAIQGGYALLFNHRADRGYRLKAFASVIKQSACKPDLIGTIGDNRAWTARYFHKATDVPSEAVDCAPAWLHAFAQKPCQVLCAGNIKGGGLQLIEELRKEGGRHHV